MRTFESVVQEIVKGLEDGSIVLQAPPPVPAISKEEDERLWELFHRLWSRDVGTEGYDKKLWVELEALIFKKGKSCNL